MDRAMVVLESSQCGQKHQRISGSRLWMQTLGNQSESKTFRSHFMIWIQKKSRQQEKITACGAGEVYTTSDTELTHSQSGVCHSFTSTTKGTGKDNPSDASDITKTQAARSVTYEFHSRATISFSASVSGKGKNPRPILFSFEPQVACGASDAEKRCAQ